MPIKKFKDADEARKYGRCLVSQGEKSWAIDITQKNGGYEVRHPKIGLIKKIKVAVGLRR